MISISSSLQLSDFKMDAYCRLPGKGVTVVFGPSGCGKTSLLRSIAGLETGCRGELNVNGEVWQNDAAKVRVPAHQRGVGFVFQQPGLFPHLSVEGNLLFGYHLRGGEALDRDRVITTLELGPLLHREVKDLSGGEQQRVALGRALLSNPRLLLLDEPLAALDVTSKSRLIPFLENALHLLDIPAIYVTHSPEELVRLADYVVVMDKGCVVADGPLVEICTSLETPLAGLDDAFSVLKGQVVADRLPGLSTIQTLAGNLFHTPQSAAGSARQVRLKIQARDVSLSLERAHKSSILNILPATVEAVSEVSRMGNCTVKLNLDGDKLLARISDYSRQQLELKPGSRLYAQVKAAALLQAD